VDDFDTPQEMAEHASRIAGRIIAALLCVVDEDDFGVRYWVDEACLENPDESLEFALGVCAALVCSVAEFADRDVHELIAGLGRGYAGMEFDEDVIELMAEYKRLAKKEKKKRKKKKQ
jgi:hypothetical protein